MSTRVTIKGQVTIPQHIRDMAGIAVGRELNWSYDPSTRCVVATMIPDVLEDQIILGVDGLVGSATRRMTTDQIMALTRDWPEE